MLIRYSLSSSVLHTVPTDNSGFFRQILTKKTPIEPSRIVTRMARRTARITAGEEKEAKDQAGEGALLSGRRGSLPATCLVGKATSTLRLLIQNENLPPRVMDRREHVHNGIPFPGEAVAAAQ